MKATPLMKQIHAAYKRSGRLFVVHCDLLYQCDLDCQHCYLDEKGTRNRDSDFWHDVIDQLGDMEVMEVIFSGGEPFLRRDFLDLVAHARDRGLQVKLNTHGGLIGPAEAARLAELGVYEVQVSYYSPNPEVHDHITRRPGSHEATLRAIKEMVAHGVPVKAACCAMGPNVGGLDEMKSHCLELGVELGVNAHLTDGLGGSLYPREMALSREQAVAVIMDQFRLQDACTSPTLGEDWAEHGPCGAGRSMLYITPEGQVTPCRTWPQVFGDLTRGDRLSDIWRGVAPSQPEGATTLNAIRTFRNRERQGCSSCDSVASCSYCPGQAYAEHGDTGQPATTVCDTGYASATALARLLDLPEPAAPPSSARSSLFPILTSGQVQGTRT